MSKTRCLVNRATKLLQSTTTNYQTRCLFNLLRQPSPQSSVLPITRTYATKSDQELIKFLSEEIATEKQNQKSLPKLDGFETKIEGAEVTLTKNGAVAGEKIIVSLNVNHTVDSAVPDDGTGEAPEMLSRPNFEVDIVKANGRTLSFTCAYVHPEEQDGQEEVDLFAIEEVTMFDGDKISDKNYAVAGDILDGYLYDIFMNMLEERGIDQQFADNLSAWCSAHEHSQYINLLQQVESFAKM